MDEEVLLASIMMDIEPRYINKEILLRERKTYLIDSPLRAEIEVLILSGSSFSDSVIRAYEQHTEDLEERIKNFQKGYVLIDNSPPPLRAVNSEEYDQCDITRLERENKLLLKIGE